MTVSVPWEDFEEMHDFSESTENYLLIAENLVDETHRWFLDYELIYQELKSGKYFRIHCRKGKTEYQESERAKDCHSQRDFVECQEVQPVQKTITVWENV